MMTTFPEFWPSFYPAQLDAEVSLNCEFTNAYSYFCDAKVWLEDSTRSYKTQSSQKTVSQRVYAPIQQGLADLDPDVDAILDCLLGRS